MRSARTAHNPRNARAKAGTAMSRPKPHHHAALDLDKAGMIRMVYPPNRKVDLLWEKKLYLKIVQVFPLTSP
jgi:hypothetical protein